jgi:hypothetical protein
VPRRGAALGFLLVLWLTPAAAQWSEETLQRAFLEGARQMQAGNLAQAERIFRDLASLTGSPRVKLELARVLHYQGRHDEAKALFEEVARSGETPWRVRDNIADFVQEIEARTGYLKLGASVVSDSNPRNLSAQKEFSIGGLRVTSTESPKRATGLRYSARGWLPISALEGAGYMTASYLDFPGGGLDRLSADLGLLKAVDAAGRLRAKAGWELGTFGGRPLYSFPYVGADAVLAQTASGLRLLGEAKVGKVRFADFSYLDAVYWSSALTVRSPVGRGTAALLRGSLESSRSYERAYSYRGWELAPGLQFSSGETPFWTAITLGYGRRTYADTDPLFGQRRLDRKQRFEAQIGNREWRWQGFQLSLQLSAEDNRSNIEFFSYRKAGVSIVLE